MAQPIEPIEPVDVKPGEEYTTQVLADGREVDVFRNGVVQVHDMAGAWEFNLPAMPEITGTPLTITVHQIEAR